MTATGADRRGARRIDYLCDVECETGAPDPVQPRMRDLSVTGAFIESITPIPVGSRLRLRFVLPTGEISVSAEVANQREAGSGVRFLDLTDEQRAVIEKAVEQGSSAADATKS